MNDSFKQQVTNWFNKYFDTSKWNWYDLKSELGFLANDANEPVVDKCASMFGVSDPNDRRYIRISSILSELAHDRLYTMDESFNMRSDNKLESRIARLEKIILKKESGSVARKDEAFPALALAAAKAIAKNLPLIIKTFTAIKDALDKDPDTAQNEERKDLSDKIGKIADLVKDVSEPLTNMSNTQQ